MQDTARIQISDRIPCKLQQNRISNQLDCLHSCHDWLHVQVTTMKAIKFIYRITRIWKFITIMALNIKKPCVSWRQVASGAYTEFNLLKTRKTTGFEITKEIKSFSILVLMPPPLDYNILTGTFAYLFEMNLRPTYIGN